MEVLQVLMDPILPVFAILAFGFAMGFAGKTSVDDARRINRFAMSVLLPVLVFGLIANAPVHSFSVLPLAIYAFVEAITFTGGFLLARRIFGREPGEAVLLAFCGIFANNAFYVLPISILLYGEANVLPVTAIITLDSTVTFAGSIIALQMIKLGHVSVSNVLLSIAKTPLLQAIALGVLFSLLRIAIPAPAQTFIDFNGAAAAPVALFALGVVLSRTPFRAEAVVATFSAVKLILFPTAIWLGLKVFASNPPGSDLFLLGSAGPSGAMAFSLALLYDVKTDAIAQIIVWTSLLTLVTLAILA